MLWLLQAGVFPLTAAFFAGRLVSYSIYLSVASVAERSLGGIVTDALTSPAGIGLQLAMLLALAILLGGFRPEGHVPGRPWDSADERTARDP